MSPVLIFKSLFTKLDVVGLGCGSNHKSFVSASYKEALIKAGHVPGTDGLPFTASWSVEGHLIPGDNEFGRKVTREQNEFAAALKREYPTKFGFFASLPLPDIENSLVEIDYALDELNADGFIFLSNYHGLYLGDPRLASVYAKLQARGATIFVHPTAPCIERTCSHSPPTPTPQRMLQAAPLSDSYMIPFIEFFFDSTRTFLDLMLSGTVSAHPDITWVVPHCGTALPSLLDRATMFSDIKEMFGRQFYFDLAGVCMPNQIHHLLRWVNSSRLLYGSDVPFTPDHGAEKLLRAIEDELPKMFDESEIHGIYEGNARRLLGMVDG